MEIIGHIKKSDYRTQATTGSGGGDLRYELYWIIVNITSRTKQVSNSTGGGGGEVGGIFYVDALTAALADGTFQDALRAKSQITRFALVCNETSSDNCRQLQEDAATEGKSSQSTICGDHYSANEWRLFRSDLGGSISGYYGYLVTLLCLWGAVVIISSFNIHSLNFDAHFNLSQICCYCSEANDQILPYRRRDKLLAEKSMIRVCYVILVMAIVKLTEIVYLIKVTLGNSLPTYACVEFMTIFDPEASKEGGFYSAAYATAYGLTAPLLLISCVLRIEWMHVLMKSLGLVHTGSNRLVIILVRLFCRLVKYLSVLSICFLVFLFGVYIATDVNGSQLPCVVSGFAHGVTIAAAILLVVLIAVPSLQTSGRAGRDYRHVEVEAAVG